MNKKIGIKISGMFGVFLIIMILSFAMSKEDSNALAKEYFASPVVYTEKSDLKKYEENKKLIELDNKIREVFVSKFKNNDYKKNVELLKQVATEHGWESIVAQERRLKKFVSKNKDFKIVANTKIKSVEVVNNEMKMIKIVQLKSYEGEELKDTVKYDFWLTLNSDLKIEGYSIFGPYRFGKEEFGK